MTAEQERRSRRALYPALGFERYAAARAGQLSGGTLAKLNLSLALLPDPQVLLLDEPLARRFLADYGRNPVNLLMLVLVPAVFTGVAAGSLASAAKLLGGSGGTAVQDATAAWSAAFIAALAAYFQMRAARAADRRLVLAGLPAWRLAASRAVTGLALTVIASAAAVATLAARSGIADPGRVLTGTLLAAVRPPRCPARATAATSRRSSACRPTASPAVSPSWRRGRNSPAAAARRSLHADELAMPGLPRRRGGGRP